jgi:hypothetical protein
LYCFDAIGISLQARKIEQAAIAQVGEGHVIDAAPNIADSTGMTSIPTSQHFLDDLPLQIVLGAT